MFLKNFLVVSHMIIVKALNAQVPGRGTTEILIKYAVQYAIKNSVISGQKPNKFLITLAKRGSRQSCCNFCEFEIL